VKLEERQLRQRRALPLLDRLLRPHPRLRQGQVRPGLALGPEGPLFDSAKFFFISFSNGLYLAAHNTLRGFDRKVVKANFFRSVIAWPFATAFSPFGSLLGIPSIVQAKIWSDFVAGFIEGGGKYMKVLRLRRRDLEDIVPRIISGDQEDRFTALLDLLFLYREEPRTESSLKAVMDPGYRPMGILKDDKDAPKYSFSELYAAVMDESIDRPLVDFVLSRYGHDVAVDLAGLVALTLPAMREWFEAHAARFLAPQRQPAAAAREAEPGVQPAAAAPVAAPVAAKKDAPAALPEAGAKARD